MSRASLAVFVVRDLVKHVQDVEVFAIEIDPFLFQIVCYNLFLLLDRLGSTVDLLEQHLHHVQLTVAELSHF